MESDTKRTIQATARDVSRVTPPFFPALVTQFSKNEETSHSKTKYIYTYVCVFNINGK